MSAHKNYVNNISSNYNLKMLFAIVSMAVIAAFFSAYGYGKWRASDLSAKASSYTAVYPLNGKVDASKVTIKACADENKVNVVYSKASEVKNASANLWIYDSKGNILGQDKTGIWYDGQVATLALPTKNAVYMIGRVDGKTQNYKIDSKSDRFAISKLNPC